MATENAKANADQKSLVAEIRGQLGDIRKGIANLNQPVYQHADGRGFNQWLGEEDTPVVVKRGVNRAYQPIVPVDYKPYQIWKGLSGG
jgi:hypothetical protein